MSQKKRPLPEDFETVSIPSKKPKYNPDENKPINNIAHHANDDKFSDITFIVGSGDNIKNIKGVRALFAMQSTVFGNMLYGEFKENNKNEIPIQDIDPTAFEYIKSVFYAAIPVLTADIAIDVLFIAQKYLLKQLKDDVTKFILKMKGKNNFMVNIHPLNYLTKYLMILLKNVFH